MIRRVLVMAVVISLSHAPLAWAGGETLLSSAMRIVRDAGAREAAALPGARVAAARPAVAAQEQPPGVLGQPGMRKRTKLLLGLAAAAGYLTTMWVVDHRVEDNTPSSLGTRQD